MAKITVKANLNQGTSTRPSRKERVLKEPKKKRPILDKMVRKYSPTLVYPPLDEDAQNQLADELKDWASKTSALRIERFALEKGMNPYRFKKVRDKNPYFAEAYQTAELFFACKYSEGSLKKEFDAGTAHRHLWMVDPEFYQRTTELEHKKYELDKEKHELAKKVVNDGSSSGKIFVEIAPLVADEKKTEEPTE